MHAAADDEDEAEDDEGDLAHADSCSFISHSFDHKGPGLAIF